MRVSTPVSQGRQKVQTINTFEQRFFFKQLLLLYMEIK